MTHEEFKAYCKAEAARLRAEGKNPHGELREWLIEFALEEMEAKAKAKA